MAQRWSRKSWFTTRRLDAYALEATRAGARDGGALTRESLRLAIDRRDCTRAKVIRRMMPRLRRSLA